MARYITKRVLRSLITMFIIITILFALLRLMPGISTDSVSLLAGAKGLHFGRFFLGSMVGCMPQAVTVTLMGSAATDPLSPGFLIPLAALVIILVATLLMKKLVAAKRKDPSADE